MCWVHLFLPELYRKCCDHFEISTTVCTILVRINVINTCGAMICLWFGIVFLLLFKHIENAVYTSFQNSMLFLFINGLIFDIMNIQNNQSLEFERVPMHHLLDLSMAESFHGYITCLLSLSKISWILFSNAKETLQKMLAIKYWYQCCGKHMNDWK